MSVTNKKYFLMVKMALGTNLKYLCQTSKPDPISYKGSGLRWLKHIKKHKSHIVTWVIESYNSKDDLKKSGIYYSDLWNIVESKDWANLKKEEGDGGGSGKIGRKWKVRNTSNMKGGKNRTLSTSERKRISDRMKGKNPRNLFPPTEKQTIHSKKFRLLGTEASKKKIKAIISENNYILFNSKKEACNYFNISYDILNYRILKNKDWNGIIFMEVINEG